MEWWNDFTQRIITGAFLNSAAWVDGFALLFIFLGIIYGTQNGLLSEIAEILQIMIVIFIVFQFYGGVELFIRNHLKFIPRDSAAAAGYVTMLIAVWLAAAFIYKFLKRLFHTQLARPLHVIGGALLGGVHLLIIFSFLVQTVNLMPISDPKKALQKGGSISGHYVAAIAPAIHTMILNPLQIFQDTPRA